MNLIDVKNYGLILQELLKSVDSLDELQNWLKSPGFIAELEVVIIDMQLDSDFGDSQKQALKDLFDLLENYKKEMDAYSLAKHQNVNEARKLADLAFKLSADIGHNDMQTLSNLHTKVCGNPNCGELFTTEYPTQEYCCEACKRTARRLRRKNRDKA